MKILLIEALKKKNIFSAIYPPLGLFYLKAYTQKFAGFETEFLIESAGDISEKAANFKPDIVGISCVTSHFSNAIKLADRAKEILGGNVPVILGGCHISTIPRSLPDVFDAAVIGEGEVTFLEVLKVLHSDNKLKTEVIKDIPGLAYIEKSNVKMTTGRESIEDLDIVPIPDRKTTSPGVTHMITSRGCPYSCVYCATRSMWGRTRVHSPRYVVNEMLKLHESGINEIILFDDNFLSDSNRLHEIAEIMHQTGLTRKLKFICYGRTRAIRPEIVNDLAAMGVREIYLGADSIMDSVIRDLRDEKSYEQSARAVDLCRKAGMEVNCSFVIGLPHHTTDDLDRIYEFIKSNRRKLKALQVSPLNLFPGTPLWDYAVKQGKIDEGFDDWAKLESFTHIRDFKPENYIYLNEKMPIEVFADYCKRFEELL